MTTLISEKIEKRDDGYYKVRTFEEATLLTTEEIDARIAALEADLGKARIDKDNLEIEIAKK